ncbi:hypothetical protein BOX15_Mlig015838g1 [Macrostomum lignano]|uniref:GRIP domain-containing protein n=1 Tax=Macrostomum lignano TaxID=282301 RepID=A0A267FEK2_9PLAT|nr:hypothetical protein BOX15_Mlig016411g1 [Macrostomum lignano]PAA71644.1 hypothetical protein BOX15_Mlig015838g1 [Macrostomum lignano]
MALSDADFQSLQQQLVDAKSALYQSREDGLKLKQELLDQRARSADLERDAARAADLLARSRRARELEQLMADNEKLRVKVQNAEDDFKLQYATLMTEYSSVLSENERLQSQLETYKAASRRVAPADGAADSVDVADAGDTADSAADAAEPALQRSEDYLDQKVAILQAEVTKLCEEKSALQLQLSASEEERTALQAAKKELLNQIGEFQLATDELRRANQQAEAAVEAERASNGAALAKMAEATERRLERQRREADLALGELERRLRAEAAEAERDLQDRLAEAETRLVAEEERRQQQLAEAAAEAEARAAEAAERASAEAEELRAAQRSLSAELETARSDAEAARSEVSELRQQLQDSQQDVRLAERKVELHVRDLRKQLAAEKRRCARLQEKLRDSLAGQQPDDQGLLNRASQASPDDKASNLSWNSGSCLDAGGGSGGAPESEQDQRDLRDLIDRLTRLQAHNSQLRDQVELLETANSAMAEDLLQKSSLIDRYLQTGRPAPASQTASPAHATNRGGGNSSGSAATAASQLSARFSAKLSELTKPQQASDYRDMNKNLRDMLEELLMRNIHLEEAVQHLAKELQEAKSAGPTA